MNSRTVSHFLALIVVFGFAISAIAAPPRIGYIYPAGGAAGSSFEVTVGGQYLQNPTGAVLSGEGFQIEVIEHDKFPPNAVLSDYRDKLRTLKHELDDIRDEEGLSETERIEKVRAILPKAELDEKKIRLMSEESRQRSDPKHQRNAQISERVRLKVTIDESVAPGHYFFRLQSADGLSNPMRFAVGAFPEVIEPDPHAFDLLKVAGVRSKNDENASSKKAKLEPATLPATFNGRILPGETDEFSFMAKEGERLVVILQARNLIPYLADAVPGWFQAVISLTDARGREVAYADDYLFDPDPVLFYQIPRDGEYRIRVYDAIFRGREDFVYRITIGELPFVTAITPIGGMAGSEVDITYHGANLTEHKHPRTKTPNVSGIVEMKTDGPLGQSNPVAFHLESFPEETEREDNDRIGMANPVKVNSIINGSIGVPGDVDFFRVGGTGNRPVSFEIFARRLGSPLDANLTVYDDDGKVIGFNDDYVDPVAGLTTHHADSRLTVTLPPNGRCFVRVADTQNRASYAHIYRLRIAEAIPTFALRVTPSTLNVKPGATTRLSIHALRIDGYEGPINLRLRDAPDGFALRNVTVPAEEEKIDISLAAPSDFEGNVSLIIEGVAEINGKEVVVEAVAAEDMMQAFAYRHLVPVDALLVDVRNPPERPKP